MTKEVQQLILYKLGSACTCAAARSRLYPLSLQGRALRSGSLAYLTTSWIQESVLISWAWHNVSPSMCNSLESDKLVAGRLEKEDGRKTSDQRWIKGGLYGKYNLMGKWGLTKILRR